MNIYIQSYIQDSINLKQEVLSDKELLNSVEMVVDCCVNTIINGGKLLICGNGGSASDAQHFAGEIIGRFLLERQGYPAICLNTDTSIMTAVANDYGYDKVFERQVEGLGNADDILIGISTSGNSKNIVEAFKIAKKIGIKTVALVGKDGGEMGKLSDVSMTIRSNKTPNIQEAHIMLIHAICGMIEKRLCDVYE